MNGKETGEMRFDVLRCVVLYIHTVGIIVDIKMSARAIKGLDAVGCSRGRLLATYSPLLSPPSTSQHHTILDKSPPSGSSQPKAVTVRP